MKSINDFIIEKLNKINSKNSVKPKDWVEFDDITEEDFRKAIKDYGTFEYEDILSATYGEPLYIDNYKVMGISIDVYDNQLKYYYKSGPSIKTIYKNFDINNIDSDIIEQLYNYIINCLKHN